MTWSAGVAALAAAIAAWCWMSDASLRRLNAAREGPGLGHRMVPWAALRLTTRRAENRAALVRAGVPTVCELLAVSIEAGRPPRAALRVVAQASPEPTRGVLLGVWNRIDLGVDEREAWVALGQEPGYRGIARGLARSVGTGVELGALLRSHAAEARTEVGTRARARARQVAVTGVLPLVACYLPAFILVGVVPIFGGLLGSGLLGRLFG